MKSFYQTGKTFFALITAAIVFLTIAGEINPSPLPKGSFSPASKARLSPTSFARLSPASNARLSPTSFARLSPTSFARISPASNARLSPASNARLSPTSFARLSPLPKGSPSPTSEARLIQVALLLDTSNSMDGLINQAKSRLWNIVNTLTTLRFNGQAPEIQIALFEYGNDRLRAADNYIRLVAPLTTDLDLISEKLFALTTDGGLEYCGAVIRKATNELKWSTNAQDIHLIYIAGNEPFTQGKISYKEAISEALGKNITVNTIHCGERNEGISGLWKDGADRGKGEFFNIDHNVRVRYIITPYDVRIDECNTRLNNTYISYGALGESRKENQSMQDRNAGSISSANKTERIVSKSGTAYKNASWDLVDLATENEDALRMIKQTDLPKELQGKSEAELKAFINQKQEERAMIQKEIESLSKQRQAYIDEEMKKSGEDDGDDLGTAINRSVMHIAATKGYK